MTELPVWAKILSTIGAIAVAWIFFVKILPSFFGSDDRKPVSEIFKDKNLTTKEEVDLLVEHRRGKSEKELREKLRNMREEGERTRKSDSRYTDTSTNHEEEPSEPFESLLGELLGSVTENPDSEIVREKMESQKTAVRKRMPDEKNGTERVHQTNPLTIGRRTEGDTLRILWEWEGGFNHRLVGFRDTGGHHHEPYDPNKNGRQIVDTAERSGQTIDRPGDDGPFYYTFYLISGGQHGSKDPATVRRADTPLGNLLKLAEEHGAQLSHRGLIRFSVDLSESHQSDSSAKGGQLRPEFEEVLHSFGSKTRALNELRKRRDEEIEKVEEMYENGEISREEMEELMQMIEDEYDSARLRIKEDF